MQHVLLTPFRHPGKRDLTKVFRLNSNAENFDECGRPGD